MTGYDKKLFEISYNGVLKKYRGNSPAVVVPDGVTAIGVEAFAETPVTTVRIPPQTTRIEQGAFQFCTRLQRVEFSDGLEVIAEEAFMMCENLREISFPKTLKEIGFGAFIGCRNLARAELPENLETMGSSVFLSCDSLENLSIYGVKTLPMMLFSGCASLKSVTLHDGLENIEAYAFMDCPRLERVNIPATVNTIESAIFINTPAVTAYCEAPFKPAGWCDDWNADEKSERADPKVKTVWNYRRVVAFGENQ